MRGQNKNLLYKKSTSRKTSEKQLQEEKDRLYKKEKETYADIFYLKMEVIQVKRLLANYNKGLTVDLESVNEDLNKLKQNEDEYFVVQKDHLLLNLIETACNKRRLSWHYLDEREATKILEEALFYIEDKLAQKRAEYAGIKDRQKELQGKF